ncbi:NitT/TauT family transport system ATP-binding protein [Paenibacillus algorifonticola]|uniref:NitT/TauT family transport system ATP-binding protein n=1 Tax=Paenibacillus algorifonticola TaxID=684063 RepID=A0A1I2GIU8_9BACL|nr:ABC transporter ATP-binding protein [Paenibacillus algorifonticola]SFF16890.1 NitT/TauT family transport system ATP-binding protein [Paenibacillus algorifonticola]
MQFDNIKLTFGGKTVFRHFSLQLGEGKITCLMGASGIGKTTLLRCAAGLEKPEQGRIIRNSISISKSSINKHRISYVFQEPRLLPGKTVLENVRWVLGRNTPIMEDNEDATGPSKSKSAKNNCTRDMVIELLREAGLASAIHHYPHQLSGGMRQRVSLVRAFAASPDLLLMDEPFQSLDPAARLNMHQLLLKLWEKDKPTVLLVTHDCDEALRLGSRIVLLAGSPASIAMDIHEAQHLIKVSDEYNTSIMRPAETSLGSAFNEADQKRLKQLIGAET